MSARPTLEPLTKRQREVLDLLVRGRTNYEIAQHLGISLDGAKWHVREVLARLGVESREQAADIWRRERSWPARGTALLAGLFGGSAAKIAVAGAVALVFAGVVGAAVYLSRDDDDLPADTDSSPTPGTLVTATVPPAPDDLSPRSGIPIVDEVIGIARRGDLPAFRALMKEFPEPCTTGQRGVGSPPPCPPGAADGTPVDTFRAIAGERVDQGPDLDQVLGNVVPALNTLHSVATPQPDSFGGLIPDWKYEVFVYGPLSGQSWAVYFLDDDGIVGLYASSSFGVTERRDNIQPDGWIIAPNAAVRLRAEQTLYVVGRDTEIRLSASLLAPACVGKPFAIRLYAYPDPGVVGGIQVPADPALGTEVRSTVGPLGDRIVSFRLPPTLPTPTHLRPGLLSPCLSDIAVQGAVELALLAPPGDEDIAILEVEGRMLDHVALRGGDNATLQSAGEWMGGELTAAVDGYACATVPVVGLTSRNARGNVEFRVGEPSQPEPCRTPGNDIYFVMTARGDGTEALYGSFEHVPGAIQLVRNLGPEPPGAPARAPLIR